MKRPLRSDASSATAAAVAVAMPRTLPFAVGLLIVTAVATTTVPLVSSSALEAAGFDGQDDQQYYYETIPHRTTAGDQNDEEYYYSPDGTNNNLRHPRWGSASTARIRSAPPLNSYVDGISRPRTEADGLPSARRVLLELFRHVPPHANKDTSQLLLYFGQFIAHDITRSKESLDVEKDSMPIPCGGGGGDINKAEGSMEMPPSHPPIPHGALGTCNFAVAAGAAASSCPGSIGGAEDGSGTDNTSNATRTASSAIVETSESFTRMQRSAATAAASDNNDLEEHPEGRYGYNSSPFAPTAPRAATTINFATSYLDLDHLYGPIIGGPPEADIRSFEGGKMILDPETGLPPKDPTTGQYVCADPQTRLGPSLTALAAVFLRYHNLRADHHAKSDPTLSDEELYWLARRETTAAYQNMVEEKYVPTTLGQTLDPYEGYNPNVDPGIDVFFSTCAFRYGHSGLSGVIRLLDADFRPTPQDPMLLRDAFDQTESVLDTSEDAAAAILRGMAAEPAKAVDASFVDDVAFFTKMMAVANVQRGRDAGLPSYNDAREWFGLGRAQSFEELASANNEVTKALQGLYKSVDDVDSYVGGLLEPSHSILGPLMTASMKEQFGRLRDGDRYWYKALLTEEEIAELPSLSDMIKMTFGEEEMKYFPFDSFAAVDQLAVAARAGGGGEGPSVDDASLSLLEGSLRASWTFTQNSEKTRSMDMTLRVGEMVKGGYVGIGWGSQSMRGAEIWFCIATDNVEPSSSCSSTKPQVSEGVASVAKDPVFSCCVAKAGTHVVPRCVDEGYHLTVIDSCISGEESFVTLRAPLCKLSGNGSKCYYLPEGEIDFIAAYSPSTIGAHGFSRRTSGRLDLNTGWGASASSDSANGGLFALHGGTMIVCWFILVPAAIWIVRYCKGKSWRLVAHIALVGVAGSLVFAVATAAIVSVEGTSFGTVEGGSVFSKHKIVGLCVVGFVLFMLITGEARRTREINKVLKTRWVDRAVLLSHRCGGFTLLAMAWWNCYTGLGRMEAYEADAVEITWLSTHTTTTDMQFFTIFRRYVFFPWIIAICLIFFVTEFRHRRKIGANHLKRVAAVRRGSMSLWGSVAEGKGLQEMSIQTFLELTRQGSPFCIVDGFVIDIGAFMDYHPGGSRILRFAIGSDISEHIIGQRDVDGVYHVHSPTALKTLRTLIKAKLTVPENDTSLGQWLNNLQDSPTPTDADASTSMTQAPQQRPRLQKRLSQRGINLLVFRDATIADIEHVTLEKSIATKPVVRIRLALKKEKLDFFHGTPLPSTTFVFRGKDAFGGTVERPYTPVKCFTRETSGSNRTLGSNRTIGGAADALPTAYNPSSFRRDGPKKEEVVYEFLINLIPDGLMSTFLNNKKKGSHIMVQGPMANEEVLTKVDDAEDQRREVILIAAGTGIAPMLQIIDHFLGERETSGLEPPRSDNDKNKPKVFLAWIVYCKTLSFEGAAQLRERARQFREHFKYFIIYAHDNPSRLLKHGGNSQRRRLSLVSPKDDEPKEPSQSRTTEMSRGSLSLTSHDADGDPKRSSRRMSLTRGDSAPDGGAKKTSRRMSLTRGDSVPDGGEKKTSRRMSHTRDNSAPDAGGAKKSSRRMSLTRNESAPDGGAKKSSRRMSLTRNDSAADGGAKKSSRRFLLTWNDSAPDGGARKPRRKSFTTGLEGVTHEPTKSSRRTSPTSPGDGEPEKLSIRQRRASLTSPVAGGSKMKLSLRERRGRWSNAFKGGSSNDKLKIMDYDSDSSSFMDSSDDEENSSVPESFDSPAARRQFQSWYRAKGRFDKDLLRNLLPMATGKHYDVATYLEAVEAGEEDDDELLRTRIRVTYRDTLVAVCGRPAFDDNCIDILTDLGFDEDQLITFHSGNVPLGQVVQSYMTQTSTRHTFF